MSNSSIGASFAEAIDNIAKEKGLETFIVVDTIKESLLKAIKKRYGTSSNVEITIEPDDGILEIKALKTVVRNPEDPATEISKHEAREIKEDAMAGDEIWVNLPPLEFGRNAIQMAKQQLIQKIREAEREQIFEDYQHKVGEIMRGVVQRIYRGDIYLNIGRNEAVIPSKEVIPGDMATAGKNMRALVIKIEKEVKGPQIVLSRTVPHFLQKLFEFEVPEIYEGLVEIVSIAREPGERSKIAVYSTNAKIDPVGACVGLKGSRVQAVVKELSGEKIDIIEFSPDPEMYVSRALAPATVLFAELYHSEKKIIIVVPDDQLSLAIGTKGRNARLAAKLTGWRITLLSETQYKALSIPIEKLPGISENETAALHNFEIDTIQKLAKLTIDAVGIIPNLETEPEALLKQAREIVENVNLENAFVTRITDEDYKREKLKDGDNIEREEKQED
ncbi:MAG: transcription termination factor NusA [Candidatus Zixiibacteriota bacterium]